MPPKPTLRKFRPSAHAGALHPALAEFLLEGRYPTHAEAPHEIVLAAFDHAAMARLWRAHRAALLVEAHRRGITPYMGEIEGDEVPSARYPSVLVEAPDPRAVFDPRCKATELIPRCEAGDL